MNKYAARFEAIQNQLNRLASGARHIAKSGHLQSYLETLKWQELINEFDEVLWYGMVDQVRVTQDGKLRFIFKDKTEIEE